MLPLTYFERISSAYGLCPSEMPRERRKSIRATFRSTAELHEVRGRLLGRKVNVRMRELSRGGCSMLSSRPMRLGEIFLLSFDLRGSGQQWFWCVCRRCVMLDRLSNLVGCEFKKVLYPGQEMGEGVDVARALWLDVEGDREPEDPLGPMN